MRPIDRANAGATVTSLVPQTTWHRGHANSSDWLPIVLLPAMVIVFTPPGAARWIAMWALAFSLYCGCKWLTWRRAVNTNVPVWRQAAYLLAWPGLDAAAFLHERSDGSVDRNEWVGAIYRVIAGLALIFLFARRVYPHSAYGAGWVGMVGTVLVLHFGVFALLSCVWRGAGIAARPLMHAPTRSQSLGEFWSRRWNTAFRDLTHRFLFRPLSERFGVTVGVVGGFVFSGLVHDLVISWPASGGWGGPTVFFTIQGAGILLERSKQGRDIGLGGGRTGHLFAAVVLVLPAPLLFHRPFVERITIPFLHAMGAL